MLNETVIMRVVLALIDVVMISNLLIMVIGDRPADGASPRRALIARPPEAARG